jgi:predicted acyl esterase
MVRSEVMRGRFRNSFSKPEPFVANKKTAVNIKLQDVMHTFKRDIKSKSKFKVLFPLIDLNPQTLLTISSMQNQKIFEKQTHRVYADSKIIFSVVK